MCVGDGDDCSPLHRESRMEQENSTTTKGGGGGERSISRYYYYLDYGLFINVVRLKLYKIRQRLESSLQIQEANYFCSSCDGKWSLLETQMLFHPESSLFMCPTCNMELETITANASTTTLPGGGGESMLSSQYHKFMDMQSPIVTLLKKTDNIVVAPVDIQALIKRATVHSNEEAAINTTDLVYVPDRSISPIIPTQTGKHKEEREPSSSSSSSSKGGVIEVDIVKSTFHLPSLDVPKEPILGSIQVAEITKHLDSHSRSISAMTVAAESLSPLLPLKEKIYIEVQGRKISIDEISEEDLSLMSSEEYELYYNALQDEERKI